MSPRSERASDVRAERRGGWTRVYAEVDGNDVSHLSYSPYPLQVGREGAVRMAGIAGVGTNRRFRGQGLASAVFAHAIDRIRAEGHSCVGLFTSMKIIAHRLYRRFGLKDVVHRQRGFKLLDPGGFTCHALSAMIRRDADIRRERPVLRIELLSHEAVDVRLEEERIELLSGGRRKPALSLTMSGGTLLAVKNRDLSMRRAETARLVSWRGDAEVHRLLLSALDAYQRPVL
jgi:GNAT superfamily N-acetyltransferase